MKIVHSPDFRRLAQLLMLAVLACGFSGQAVLAQETSANIRGQVRAADGDPVAGAEVRITHIPSGTVSRSRTGSTGQFFESGLRIGGPYEIRVATDDYGTTVREDIFLKPGSQNPLAISMEAADAAVDRITVTGTRVASEIELNNGVGSAFSASDIAEQPTTDRDVISTLLRDPLAQSDGVGQLSVAGTNPRFNSFSIDGASQTDNFGLSTGTYATSRSPINLDAVESVTLAVADYSVTASDFVGAGVNITTKSGTNEFDGSAFWAYNDDSFVGNSFDGGNFDPGEFEEEEYGFTLGGPIIKDKLFFFVSYDEYENAAPVDFTNFDEQNGVDPAFFDTARGIIEESLGFDPGTRPQVVNVPETSERTLVKLDWNVTDDQRLSFTYQDTEESDVSVDADEFESAWYDIPLDVEAWTGQLFSDWTNNFSTNLRVNYTETARGQICRAGPDVGQISLDFFDISGLAGSPLEGLLTEGEGFVAGCDNFRHANDFEDERLQLFGSGEYLLGDHIITFGGEFENYELFNLFVPFSRGDFQFDTFDQLANANPSGVFTVNVPSGNALDGAATWEYDLISFFVQDQWAITPDFELSAGIRYERFEQDDKPEFSQPIFDRFGVRTDNNLDGNDLIMPRVSFLWTPALRTSVSGGFGLFSGGNPEVWISNSFQKPTFSAFGSGFTNVDITQVPQELQDQIASGTAVPIDFIGEDFDTPSDWKASIRLQQGFDLDFGGIDLGDDYVFRGQFLYTRTKDAFVWDNLAQTQRQGALPTGVAPDGRPIYADLEDLGFDNLTRLGNEDGAESKVLTLGLSKVFDSGFNFDVSYAYTDAEIVSEGTSSRGISNWRALFTVDRNNPDPRTSTFQIEDSFKFNFGFERSLLWDLQTRIDVFGRLFKGDVWSSTFDVDDDNALFGRAGAGEDPFDNNPLYIPTPNGDDRVVYGSGFDVAGFFGYVEENGIPVGKIHEPNSEISDRWNNIWDLRFQQELPGIPGVSRFVGDNKFKLILDIANFPNLINSDWGRVTNGPFFGQASIVEADLVSAADVAENGVDGATALTGDAPRTTCQQANDCLYRYNDFDDDPTVFTDRADSVYEIRLTLRYDF
ncbi:MAG: TonB-dependent receptor [Wenzhouxiangellaceae bacterium]|nr:TonB-dependent receptor [Wenzhouxiangellaceae bacterium]